MPTILIKDANLANQTAALVANTGSTTSANALPVTIATDDLTVTRTPPLGAAADAASTPVSLSTESKALLSTINTTLQTTNTQLPPTPSGSVQATITRPANVTPYGAGAVINGAITFATGLTSGQRAIITGMDLQQQITAIPTGQTSFRVHLYNVTPPSALANAATWTLPAGDRASYLGYVDVGTPALFTSTTFCQADQINKQIQLSGSANVFGYLVTNGGFTPAANSEVYLLRMQLLGQ